jgi:hypothetical protein
MSEEDIPKGVPWLTTLNTELAVSKFGIVCVTRENFAKPWLNFEAGAIAKAVGDSRCCPLLLGVDSAEVQGPIALLQATKPAADDLLRLVKSINDQLEESLADAILKKSFNKWLPELQQNIEEALSSAPDIPSPPKRDPSDIANETLVAVREQSRILAELVAGQSSQVWDLMPWRTRSDSPTVIVTSRGTPPPTRLVEQILTGIRDYEVDKSPHDSDTS